jgi:hypothetical protein
VWEAGIKELMARETFLDTWRELRAGLPEDFFTSLSKCMQRWGLVPIGDDRRGR